MSVCPLWNLSIARSPENRGGETFCTFLSDTFTAPPAESAATEQTARSHASVRLNRQKSGEHSHDRRLHTFNAQNDILQGAFRQEGRICIVFLRVRFTVLIEVENIKAKSGRL